MKKVRYMPKLTDYSAANVTKMLLVGDNGSGKTGALASLASAGYNLRIIDLDKGAKVLANLLTTPGPIYKPGSADRVEIESLSDSMRNIGGKLVPGKATVWQEMVKLMMNWKTASADFGSVTTWGPNDVLVIDSLTFAAKAAMDFILAANARLGQTPHQSDWYQGQQLLESLMQMLFDDNVKCNVIVNCHVTYIGDEGGPQRGYPATLGKALSPKIGSYFNTVLLAKTVGVGAGQKRQILTKSGGMIELKNASPTKVKDSYPIETGLADYFRDERVGGA